MYYKYYFSVIFLIFSFSLLLISCDSTVSPLNEKDGLYSIYGHIDVNSNENVIRIKDINNPLTRDSTHQLNSSVIFKNLDSGYSTTLQDSIIMFDEIYTHNFQIKRDIIPQTQYQIVIQSPTGKTVKATATTPAVSDVDVNPTGEDCETFVTMSFEPVTDGNHLDLQFGIRFGGSMHWAPITPSSTIDNTVSIRFRPLGILDRMFQDDPTSIEHPVWCHDLDNNKIHVQYTHYGPDFFADTLSDSLDVPGGIGQFGGLYRDSFSFRIDTSNVCRPFC